MTAESTLRKAKKLEKNGQVDQAILICETFLRKFPKNGRIRDHVKKLKFPQFAGTTLPKNQQEQLNSLFKAGDCATLIPKVVQLLGFYPHSYFLWNLLGNAHLKQGNLHKAEQALSKARTIDPKMANALVGLGDVYKSDDRPEEAIASYLKALKRQPNNLSALNNLGNVLIATGQFKEAARTFSKAHETAPRNPVILFNLSAVFTTLNQLEQAKEALQKAVTLAPTFTDAHHNLGLVHALQGGLPQAVERFETVLNLDPMHDAARVEKLHQQAHMCDWSALAEYAEQPSDFGMRGAGACPFPFLALEDNPTRQRARSQRPHTPHHYQGNA